jgi:predicted nucleotidyltransferase
VTNNVLSEPFATPIDSSRYPELARRRKLTNDKWIALGVAAELVWPKLQHADRDTLHISDRACIYVTGSVARCEAASVSDLDLFIIDHLPTSVDGVQIHDALNAIEKARLISALDELRISCNFRPFSRGGEFIRVHSFQQMLEEVGAPSDDFSNSFTARLLLLMNSRPLLNIEGYNLARNEVLTSYWDRANPEDHFLPIMLTNDIRRWWGVLCLNFEHLNRRLKDQGYASTPKRRLDNLKLRYSKLLGVYSTLLDLVDRSGADGLNRADALDVFTSLPIDRIFNVSSRHAEDPNIPTLAHQVLESYDQYLAFVAKPEDELLTSLSDEESWAAQQNAAFQFHETFVQLFAATGRTSSPLYEYCIV